MTKRPLPLRRAQRFREREILRAARHLLRTEGLGRFSMQELAKATGYSRSALYNYYPSKEDVVVALAIEAATVRSVLDRRVAEFQARPRERMVALGEVTVLLYPDLFFDELLAFTLAVREHASEERQAKLRQLDMDGYSTGTAIVRDAVDQGDLTLGAGLTPDQVLFGLATFINGVFSAPAMAVPAKELGIENPIGLLHHLGRSLLDGLGWRPLSSEWDYRLTMKRIYDEVFPHQLRARLSGTFGEAPWPEAGLGL